jgi:hypothetical protein
MIPKKPGPDTPGGVIRGGYRFSEQIMRHERMIPKSGHRFSERIMRHERMIPKSGYRFSEQIMRNSAEV